MSDATNPATTVPTPVRAEAPTLEAGKALLGTGRRKQAIARVRLVPGTGAILVNRKPYDAYFPREGLRLAIREPLLVTRLLGKYDVLASVEGGGATGQAGAIRLGIARAIAQLEDAHRKSLRSAGMMTRDPRMKERKKYGRKGARAQFQWTKR